MGTNYVIYKEIFLFPVRRGMSVFTFSFSAGVSASGMVPETSVVIVEASEGEASMNITNTDPQPLLLVTSIKDLPGDTEKLLLVTPPAIRVDGGKTQKVRFILASKTPLKTERLRRVTFNGVPPQNKDKNQVRMSISQNLPVIIRPAGLARDEAPRKRLKWELKGDTMTVTNSSPYVVRLAQSVQTLPDNTHWILAQSYVLPGEHLTLTKQGNKSVSGATQVRISPATTWGFSVDTGMLR
ncbi:fimbria/pilus chaperone family protein [Apirhabdus apintestini]|nr:fimbria/pilus chaperone family protein [Enterobacteriaceae bacterium CA-0114]